MKVCTPIGIQSTSIEIPLIEKSFTTDKNIKTQKKGSYLVHAKCYWVGIDFHAVANNFSFKFILEIGVYLP